jgi:membrane protein required for colicin V production
MNRLDIVILFIVLLYILRGIIRGFIHELLDLLTVIASLVISVLCVGAVAAWLSRVSHCPPTFSTLIAFIAVYGLIANLLRMIIRFLHRPNRIPFLQRIWGAAAGTMRGILAAGIFAFLITRFYAPQKPNWEKEKSLLVEPVGAVAPAVYHAFVAVFPRSGFVFSRMGEGLVDGADRIRDRIHPAVKDE